METLQNISVDIIRLTGKIEENYPELYQFLEENPITLSASQGDSVNFEELKDYLESLKELLKHHLETH